jgi:putative chitinase
VLTLSELQTIMPYAGLRASIYLEPLNASMDEFGIDNPDRQAAFLAQVAHESGSLKYVEELADGDAYEGRDDLGNTMPGDGRRFKGRGLLQITGRRNYYLCSQALFGDARLIDSPELLEEPDNAARSAGWFWHSNGLNALADSGAFRALTRRINGGLNGINERIAYWDRAKEVLA